MFRSSTSHFSQVPKSMGVKGRSVRCLRDPGDIALNGTLYGRKIKSSSKSSTYWGILKNFLSFEQNFMLHENG